MADKVRNISDSVAEYRQESTREVNGKKETRSKTFLGPAAFTKAAIVAYVNGLKPEEAESFGAAWLYGAGLKATSGLWPELVAAPDSPIVVRDSVSHNLVTGERRVMKDCRHGKAGQILSPLPLEKRIAAVNVAFADPLSEPSPRFVTARRMLLEEKLAVERNGVLVPAK